MRVLFALALLILGIAGLAPARAADLVEPPDGGAWPGGGYTEGGDRSSGVRALPVVIYDYEPGVSVRHYWLSPWRHRHYFPVTGKPPRLGRAENLSSVGGIHRPAETFTRYWSTTELFVRAPRPVHARMRAVDDEGLPRPGKKNPQPPMQP